MLGQVAYVPVCIPGIHMLGLHNTHAGCIPGIHMLGLIFSAINCKVCWRPVCNFFELKTPTKNLYVPTNSKPLSSFLFYRMKSKFFFLSEFSLGPPFRAGLSLHAHLAILLPSSNKHVKSGPGILPSERPFGFLSKVLNTSWCG